MTASKIAALTACMWPGCPDSPHRRDLCAKHKHRVDVLESQGVSRDRPETWEPAWAAHSGALRARRAEHGRGVLSSARDRSRSVEAPQPEVQPTAAVEQSSAPAEPELPIAVVTSPTGRSGIRCSERSTSRDERCIKELLRMSNGDLIHSGGHVFVAGDTSETLEDRPKPSDADIYAVETIHTVSADDVLRRLQALEAKAAPAELTPQPAPTNVTGDVWQELIDQEPAGRNRDLMIARRAQGIAKYGRPLGRENGRDHTNDAIQEALDGMVYAAAASRAMAMQSFRDALGFLTGEIADGQWVRRSEARSWLAESEQANEALTKRAEAAEALVAERDAEIARHIEAVKGAKVLDFLFGDGQLSEKSRRVVALQTAALRALVSEEVDAFGIAAKLIADTIDAECGVVREVEGG